MAAEPAVDVLSCNLETESGSSVFDPVIEDGGGPQDMTLHGTVDIGAIVAEVAIDVFIDGDGPVDGGTFNMSGGENQYEIVTTLVDPEDSFWLPRAPGSADVSIEVRTPADTQTFDCGTLEIVDVPSPSIVVDTCSLDPPAGGDVDAGTQVDVTATLVNEGDAQGTVDVRWLANGQIFEEFTDQFAITLDAGESETFTQSVLPGDVGATPGDDLFFDVAVLGPGAATPDDGLQFDFGDRELRSLGL